MGSPPTPALIRYQRLQITKSYASSPDSRIGLECRMGRGSANDYGSDNLGFSTALIDWYRSHLPASALPCDVVMPQAMTIVNSMPGYGNQMFTTHTLSWTISTTSVLIKKGYAVSRAY